MKLGSALATLVILAALYGFLFGFDEGIIAGALPFIGKVFTLTPASEGLMAAAVPLGAVCGVILAALFSDKLGRKRVLVGCALLFALGSALSGIAGGMTTLTIARLCLGLAIGASSLAAPMFLAELAPAALRGAVVTAYQLMITIGILISYLISLGLAPSEQWRVMLGLGAAPALIALWGMWRSPESPRWLVLKGRKEEAGETIARLQPELSQTDVDHSVREIDESIASTPPAESWRAFLSPQILPYVIFATTLFFLQQLSGINAVIYYAPKIMSEAGMSGLNSQLLATVGIGALNMVMTLVAIAVVDRMGRRPLVLIGFAGAALSLALIAYAFAQSEVHHTQALTGVFLFIMFFAVSIGPLPWIYMSELFPLRMKTRGMALAASANWSMNFLVVFLFPVFLSTFGASFTFCIFAACCTFGLVFCWFRAPETKGVSLEQLEQELMAARA
ncbi:MAG: sugar porter family MFS transporter [Pseudomonadota bacterium]